MTHKNAFHAVEIVWQIWPRSIFWCSGWALHLFRWQRKTVVSPLLTHWKHSNLALSHHYRKTSNIRRTLVGNKIVDHSDVVGASPVGAAPTTSKMIFILDLTSGFKGFERQPQDNTRIFKVLRFGASYIRPIKRIVLFPVLRPTQQQPRRL